LVADVRFVILSLVIDAGKYQQNEAAERRCHEYLPEKTTAKG
jgi:hypothetical protein